MARPHRSRWISAGVDVLTFSESALEYARAGYQVLPIWWSADGECACPKGAACGAHAGKHPLTEHGKDEATTDGRLIASWGARWPHANVALRPPVGVVVVDVDVRNSGATELLALTEEHGPLDATWAARTGGGGLHCWYRYGGPLKSTLRPGIDLKGNKGYVIVEPSLHRSGYRYRWVNDLPVAPMPMWMRTLLAPVARPQPIEATQSGIVAQERTTAGLVRTVANAAPGTRNEVLNWATFRAYERGGDSALLAEIEAAALSVGLPVDEVRRTMASAARAAGAAPA